MAGDRADHRARAPSRGESTKQPNGREERTRGPDRETPAESVRRSVTGRLLVFLDDLDLAALVTGEDGGVEFVRCLDLVVEGLDGS